MFVNETMNFELWKARARRPYLSELNAILTSVPLQTGCSP